MYRAPRVSLRSRRVSLLIAVLCAISATFAGTARSGNYVITDVAGLGGQSVSVLGINDVGWTTGWSGTFDQTAFLNTGVSVIPVGNTDSEGAAISGGYVTGWEGDGLGYQAFFYNGATTTMLGALSSVKGCHTNSYGYGVNRSGVVVGGAAKVTKKHHCLEVELPFRYQNGVMTALSCAGDTDGLASAINDSNLIVGYCFTGGSAPVTGHDHAFYYDGTMHAIPSLGGATTRAEAVSSTGDIVGESNTAAGDNHAFLYKAGLMIDLGALDGTAEASGVNSNDDVVGTSGGHAFLYSYREQHMYDLNQLLPPGSGWVLTSATGINDSGQISGVGTYLGNQQGFVLTPTLLSRYIPKLYYDSQETYYDDNVAEITDNVSASGSNKLYDLNDVELADANPNNGYPQLTLDWLRATYPSGLTSTPSDYVAENGDYLNDYRTLQANPKYADQVYGRDVTYADGEHVLQYWFFLYYNQKTFAPLLGVIGKHEGDWEGIQIHIDANGNPVDATYSQHDTAEKCPWSAVQTSAGGHPFVYVAAGSHASYFRSGTKPLADVHGVTVATDSADGAGRNLIPSLNDITTTPSWIGWPGMWGGTKGDLTPLGYTPSSPSGPGQKGQRWTDPLAWQATQGGCTEVPVLRRSASLHAQSQPRAFNPPAPRLPEITVVRRGNNAVTTYSFANWGTSDPQRRPAQLLTTTASSDQRYAPMSVYTDLHALHGRIVQPLPYGRAPYKLLVSVWSKAGTRSRVVSYSIR